LFSQPFVRYLLWQVPGWVLAAALLGVIVVATRLAVWIALIVLGLLIARDVALYPVMRVTFRPPLPTRPVGARAITVEPLRPDGMVRVRGELWHARTIQKEIPAGQEVVVTGAEGLMLLVVQSRRE
jgi:membrane-bound serine protease (ClpP class)